MVAITVILAAVIGAMMTGMIGDGFGGSSHADVSVSGDNTSEVTVSVNSMSTADGIAIVDNNGELANESADAILTNTGASVTVHNNASGDINATAGSYSIIAFQYDEDVEDLDNLDDVTGENTIAEFELI